VIDYSFVIDFLQCGLVCSPAFGGKVCREPFGLVKVLAKLFARNGPSDRNSSNIRQQQQQQQQQQRQLQQLQQQQKATATHTAINFAVNSHPLANCLCVRALGIGIGE